MTVLSSESQGISGNLEVLMRFISDYGDVVTSLGVSAVLVYLFFEINKELFLSILRLLGRALRWLFDRFSLGVAWFFVCTAVWLSFVTFLVGWNGFPVPPLDCWPVPVLCFVSWVLERLYQWQRDSDTSYKAFLLRILRGNGVNL